MLLEKGLLGGGRDTRFHVHWRSHAKLDDRALGLPVTSRSGTRDRGQAVVPGGARSNGPAAGTEPLCRLAEAGNRRDGLPPPKVGAAGRHSSERLVPPFPVSLPPLTTQPSAS